MSNELEVIIGADTKGLESGATRAERALKGVESGIKKLKSSISENIVISKGYANAIEDLTRAYKSGDISQKEYSRGVSRLKRDEKETAVETKRLTAELRNLQREQKQLVTGANMGAGAMNKFGKATSVNAVPAMTSFSQVMQDAPYGIQGVANNIQQLTMQFGYLQKSAGGTKAALKAMLGSLMGPAGILFAVSIVTSLLVAFGDKLFKSGEAAKTAAEKMEAYADSLKGIDKALLDAGVSAAKEIVTLRTLSAQATNTALSTDDRTAAVKRLRELYPTYLKGMTDEQILANGLTTAYDNVTNSIMRKARAEATANIATKNLENQINLESQLAAKTNELAKAEKKYAEAKAQTNQNTDVRSKEYRDALNAQKAVEALKETTKDLNGQIQSIQLENIDLEQSITANADLIVRPEDIKVESDGKPIKVPVTLDPHNTDILDLENDTAELRKFLDDFYDADAKINEAIGNAQYEFRLNEAWEEEAEKFKESLAETSDYTNIFASSVGSAIGELGNVMQSKLAESGKAAQIFGGLIINIMTQVLGQLAQQLITEKIFGAATKQIEMGKSAAKGVTIATNAAAALGPAGAIAFPGILAGIQGTIAGAFASIAAFNFGGFVGDNNLVRMNGDERVLTATQANRIDRIAMGQSVGMSGQRITVDITGQLTAKGNDLVTSVKRTEKIRSRRG